MSIEQPIARHYIAGYSWANGGKVLYCECGYGAHERTWEKVGAKLDRHLALKSEPSVAELREGHD